MRFPHPLSHDSDIKHTTRKSRDVLRSCYSKIRAYRSHGRSPVSYKVKVVLIISIEGGALRTSEPLIIPPPYPHPPFHPSHCSHPTSPPRTALSIWSPPAQRPSISSRCCRRAQPVWHPGLRAAKGPCTSTPCRSEPEAAGMGQPPERCVLQAREMVCGNV